MPYSPQGVKGTDDDEFPVHQYTSFNTLRTGSFKLFKRPFPGFLTILTL